VIHNKLVLSYSQKPAIILRGHPSYSSLFKFHHAGVDVPVNSVNGDVFKTIMLEKSELEFVSQVWKP